jgi:hypothetical protein
LSDFIWLNGKSPIKLSELLTRLSHGYALYYNDHQFIYKCLTILRQFFIVDEQAYHHKSEFMCEEIVKLLDLYQEPNFLGLSLAKEKHEIIRSLKSIFDCSSVERSIFDKTESAKLALDNFHSTDQSDVKFYFIKKSILVIIGHIQNRCVKTPV